MCRVLAYAPTHQWLFVSQPTNNSLYPGFGVKKVSNFLFLSDLSRDFSF